MKSLNRTLSLVLVLVMVLGMFGMASAAKLGDFQDKGDVTYKEAVDYLTAAGIVAGDTATTISPKGDLTREQAAKLMAYAMLGQAAADNLKAPAAPFTDVAANRWSAGYIAYCVQAGVINGMGDGTFAPEANVTGYQMAKMLLCALGYGVNGEFTGSGWSLETAKYALAKDIFYGNVAGASDAPANREEAFLYTFNTLTRAMLVKYNENLGVYYSGTNPFENNQKHDVNYTIGLQRFKMERAVGDSTYAEKAHYWAIDGKKVTGTYPDDGITKLAASADGTPYANLTAKSDPKYIGYSADDVCTFYINGDQQKTDSEIAAVKAAAGLRGNKVSFYDTDKNGKYDAVEVLVYRVVKLTSAPVVHTAGANDVVTISDMGMKNVVAGNITGDYKNLAKDDYVLYFSNAKKTSWTISKCETVTGQLFGFNDSVYQVNVNGTTVNASQIAMNGATNPTAAFGKAWNDIIETKGLAGTVFYYDIGKNICAAEPTQNVVAAANVVFVLDAKNALVGSSVQAEMLKSDGTTVIKTIDKVVGTDNSSKAATTVLVAKNEFFTYTENADGSYNLKEIGTGTTVAHQLTTTGLYTAADKVFVKGEARFFKDNVKDGAPPVQKNVETTGTNKTVFVIEGEGDKINTYKAYTGVATIPNVDAKDNTTKAFVLNDKDGYAIMAVALKAHSDTTTAKLDYAFIGAEASHVSMTGNASEDFYQYDYAVINGEIKKFTSVNDKKLDPGVYAINGYDGDKIDSFVEGAELANTRAYTTSNLLAKAGNLATGFDVVGNTVTVKGDAKTSFVVTDDVKVFVLDGYDKASGVVTLDKAGSIGAIENLRGDAYTVLTLRVSDKDNTINELFIGIQPKGASAPPVDTSGIKSITLAAGEYTVNYYGATAPSDSDCITAIKNQLAKDGYTVTKVAEAAGKYTFTATKNGVEATRTFDPSAAKVRLFKVTAPVAVAAAGDAGAYSATVDVEYAKNGDTVTVKVKTITAATGGTDAITLTGVTGGTASTSQNAAAVGSELTFTYTISSADSQAVINVSNS